MGKWVCGYLSETRLSMRSTAAAAAELLRQNRVASVIIPAPVRVVG